MRKSFYLSGLLFFCLFVSATAVKAGVSGTGLPVITSNPNNDTVCSGVTTWFAITANDTAGGGTMPIHYTWEVSADGGTTWDTVKSTAIYSGDSTDTLRIVTDNALNGYMYMCGATNDSGTVWSSAATLNVDTANAGMITGNIPVCQNSTLALTDAVTGGVWSNVNHAIDTVNNTGSVYGIAQGFDTVKYTVTNVCGITTAWILVRVDTTVTNMPLTGPDATCVGNTIHIMDANVIGTRTWSVSNTSASVDSVGMVTGLASGIDTVTYSFMNACNSIDTFFAVEVDTVLAHGIISGSTDVCAGSWINLTETVDGGTWLSNNSGIAITDASGDVTGVSQGVAIISYYLSNACGASAATTAITVSETASAIIGNDSVGVGGTRNLSDTTLGGTWSSSNDTIISVNSAGVAMGVGAGSATITYTVTNACGATYATMVLYTGVPAAGVITGQDSVCAGDSITLSDTITGGVGVWTSENTAIATVDGSGSVTGIALGQTSISYTYTNGFGSATAVFPVFVNAPPIDSISVQAIYAHGGDYPFYGFTKNDTGGWVATPGSWTSSNHSVAAFYSTSAPATLVVTGYGSTTIGFSVTNTCGTTDTSFVINVLNPDAGVNQVANAASELTVYPNPSAGDFTINLVSAVKEQASVTITNVVGEKVKEFSMATNQPLELMLDQPDGVYFLSATSSTGKYAAKITIAR